MDSVLELCQPTELSSQILNDLTVKWAKNGCPTLWSFEDNELYRNPFKSFDDYGEEPKRFVWAKLSTEYKWEECI